jgi:hypothetical protein
MSDPAAGTNASEQMPPIADPARLAEQTRDFAARLGAAVAEPYLAFRRVYYHEAAPSLATVPPRSDAVQRTETAALAQRALRVFPRETRAIPVLREMLDHLQWVVDIHSLTEHERSAIHNTAMTLLHGLQGGIQAWYVEWLLFAAQRLQTATDPRYYLAYPWQALLYRAPDELKRFAADVRAGDIAGIERETQRMADSVIAVLRDPLEAQHRLVFAGPDGEHRKSLYDLKTTAALALGAYLAVDTVRGMLHEARPATPVLSVIRGLPPEIAAHIVPDDGGDASASS